MMAVLDLVGSLILQTFAPTATVPLQAEPCTQGVVARSSHVIGTTRVMVVHDCDGDTDARSGALAIRSADRWFFASNGLVDLERVSGGIIRRVTFVREHVASGELANGTKAAVYTIETMNGTAGAMRFGREEDEAGDRRGHLRRGCHGCGALSVAAMME